eukprot:gene8070-12531_t
MSEEEVYVFCNNTSSIQYGIAGDDEPRGIYSPFIGQDKNKYYVSTEMDKKMKELLDIKNPIEYGIIQDFDAMEKIWDYNFEELKCKKTNQHSVIMTDELGTSAKNKRKITEIMFEKYDLEMFSLYKTPALNCFAYGRTTGISVDVGHSKMSSSVIYEGNLLLQGSLVSYYGGKEIYENLKQKLNINDENLVEKIKKRNCRVHEYPEISNGSNEYKLPDGSDLKLNPFEIYTPELLFNPKLDQNLPDERSITQLVVDSFQRVPHTSPLKTIVTEDIVVAGGSSMFPNFKERLYNELQAELNIQNHMRSYKIKLAADTTRDSYQFVGASIVGSLSTFINCAITKSIYKDNGEKCVDFTFIDDPIINKCLRKDHFVLHNKINSLKNKTVDIHFLFTD